MNSKHRPEPFPWAGLITLGMAAVITALLLAWPVSVQTVLRTWPLTRSSGIVAYLLLWASVALGLMQATGLMRSVGTAAEKVDLHEFISLGALYATAFHAIILVWDHYSPYTWQEILVPFASTHSPVLAGIGSLAFYLALLATVTTYVRKWLSPKLWRGIHQLSLAGFAMAMFHGLLMGTDSKTPAVAMMYVATAVIIAALVLARVFKGVLQNADSPR